jgi:hypothetical protein
VHASAHHGALFTDGTESVPTVHLTMVPKCARDGAEAVARDGAEAAAELSQLSAVDFEVVVVRLPAPPSSTSPSQLTLCMVSDTHGYEVQGGRMPAADVLVHCGDWCNRYEPHPAQRKPWTCLACKRSPRRPVPHRYESHPLKGSLAKLDEWLASDRCSHIGLKIVLPCMHALTTAPPPFPQVLSHRPQDCAARQPRRAHRAEQSRPSHAAPEWRAARRQSSWTHAHRGRGPHAASCAMGQQARRKHMP